MRTEAELKGPPRADRQLQLLPALQGCMRAHHRFLLRELLGMVDSLERAISRLDHEIEERLRPQEETMQRLDAVTGVSQRVLETLFAEIGWELESFPDAAHLAPWVGICPGQHESGGKRMSGRARKGNRCAKTMLVQADLHPLLWRGEMRELPHHLFINNRTHVL